MLKKILKKPLPYIVLPVCIAVLLYVMLLVYIDAVEGARDVNGIMVSADLMYCLNGLDSFPHVGPKGITAKPSRPGGFFTYNSIKYCGLLKKAATGDVLSIKTIALLDLPHCAGSGYDHGSALVGLIAHVGEDMFIRSLGTITEPQKESLESYLRAGLDYGCTYRSNLTGTELKEAFPKVYGFLVSNE